MDSQTVQMVGQMQTDPTYVGSNPTLANARVTTFLSSIAGDRFGDMSSLEKKIAQIRSNKRKVKERIKKKKQRIQEQIKQLKTDEQELDVLNDNEWKLQQLLENETEQMSMR